MAISGAGTKVGQASSLPCDRQEACPHWRVPHNSPGAPWMAHLHRRSAWCADQTANGRDGGL